MQPSFYNKLKSENVFPERTSTSTVQVNLGKLCNQTCRHCHVDAGPHRIKENMDARTTDRLLQLLDSSPSVKTVDLTGGAPELNPNFRRIVSFCRERNLHVIDRCNLTVLTLPEQSELLDFLASHDVHVVASLPCYSSKNVDQQRGDGVFAKSIFALQELNRYGYGKSSQRQLDLVYNPLGPTLPPAAKELEADYKQRLWDDFQIEFDQLFTITNMPIKRFLADLRVHKTYDKYMNLLCDNFNAAAVPKVMCTSHMSVGWDGKLYDCDFNQMLEMPIAGAPTLFNIENFSELDSTPIALANHCFGCTAGSGSSCTGSLL